MEPVRRDFREGDKFSRAMKRRWKVSPANIELQEFLSRELSILPLTAQLLINRGLVDCDRASSFLRPDLRHLHDPFLMKDMDRAVDRVVKALRDGEKIALYGDYDVDGTTATALLFTFFRELGITPRCYIPHRLREGYGLNIDAIRRLHQEGVRLIITTDCGITNHEEVRVASSLGIDCIVTDHHEVPPRLPPAVAVLNPMRRDCSFPFKALAGVGVAFNLVIALRARLREMGWFKDTVPNLKRYLDIVSIGTIADMVPLLDENRIFASYGLKELGDSVRPGLRALKDVSGIRNGKVDSWNVAFQLAPRINAAGRMDTAYEAFELLTTEDERRALELATRLDRENLSRQRLEEEIFREALAMLDGKAMDKAIVLSREGWHPGVIGIVASRLTERFTRPTVMIAIDGDTGKGSVRGIKGFNVIEGLRACEETLLRYGGHKSAAGLTLERGKIDAFRTLFVDLLNRTLKEEDLVPEVTIDAVVSLDELNPRVVSEIEKLSPFGTGNEEPLLGALDAHIIYSEVVGERHLRCKVRQKGPAHSAIAFGRADLHPISGYGFDIAFYPYMDEWEGLRSLRLRIKDVRGSA